MTSKDAKQQQASGPAASTLIDQRIRELGDWRGATLSRMRTLILEADPEMVEEWKWMGTPVWSHDGIVCTGESYKKVVKLTFAHGASLPDPTGLFNSSLEGNMRRAIDIPEGASVDADAFKALVQAAVAFNGMARSPSKARTVPANRGATPKRGAPKATAAKRGAAKPATAKRGAPKATAAKRGATKATATKRGATKATATKRGAAKATATKRGAAKARAQKR